MAGMPYAWPRPAIPSPVYCSSDGVEIAHPLFLQKNRTGQLSVEAKFMAAWKSPSLAAPSPK